VLAVGLVLLCVAASVAAFRETDTDMELDMDMETDGLEAGDAIDDFRAAVMEYLNKWKGSTEQDPDGRFKKLFGDLDPIRKKMPGFTTCTSFVPMPLAYASQKTGQKLKSNPNANFFDAQTRRKFKIPPDSFIAAVPKGKRLEDVSKDKTATYVDMAADRKTRPKPGDIFLLGFAHDVPTSKILKAGMFSHIGFVMSVKVNGDKEEWTVVAGGGGSARQKREAVTESVMVIDPTTALTSGVANQGGSERRLQGWISLDALLGKK